MFGQLLSVGALALFTVQGSSKTTQSILNTGTFSKDECVIPKHVTMHAPSNSTNDTEEGGHFYHQHGLVRLTHTKPPTKWTLERDNNYQDGWKIYWTHPNGNKQYWYQIGDEIHIGTSYYSATTVYIKSTESEDSDEPELAFYWNDRCLNYGGVNNVYMTEGSLCENVILKNVTIPEWKSTSEPCDKADKKAEL